MWQPLGIKTFGCHCASEVYNAVLIFLTSALWDLTFASQWCTFKRFPTKWFVQQRIRRWEFFLYPQYISYVYRIFDIIHADDVTSCKTKGKFVYFSLHFFAQATLQKFLNVKCWGKKQVRTLGGQNLFSVLVSSFKQAVSPNSCIKKQS